MKKIDDFTNQYSLLKTLQFKLIPVGKTLENFYAARILEQDERRAREYELVKGYIDRIHREYIEHALSSVEALDVSGYAELYYKRNRSDKENKALENEGKSLRKQISKALTSGEIYKKVFGKEMITELPKYLDNDEEIETVKAFERFSTYFVGFYENRKNMYTDNGKSTEIVYRCINDNLPKFLDNVKVFEQVVSKLPSENVSALGTDYEGLVGMPLCELFSEKGFLHVLPQSGIDRYNEVVGGYTTSDGVKVKGINEYINLYNQVGENRIPKMKMLFKQILSDRETVSFIPEKFKNDDEVLNSINAFFKQTYLQVSANLKPLFENMHGYDMNAVFVKNGTAISDFSNRAVGSWHTVRDWWNKEFEKSCSAKLLKSPDKLLVEQNKEWKKKRCFSLEELQRCLNTYEEVKHSSVAEYYSANIMNLLFDVDECYACAENLLSSPYNKPRRLAKNNDDIALIKNLLDKVKELESLVGAFASIDCEDADARFYDTFNDTYSLLRDFDRLYDKVRNYVTQKPYSKDKIKLNFENPTFLNGWALNLERERSAQLFRDRQYYYLAVMDKNSKHLIPALYSEPEYELDEFEKIVYQQMASPSKDIPNLLEIDGITVKKNGRKEKDGEHAGENLILEELRSTYLPENINRIRKTRSFSTSSEAFSKADLIEYIDYYKKRVIEYYDAFAFHFKDSDKYESYTDFLNDVDGQAYQIQFTMASRRQIMDLVDSGAIYLFRIYSKDFSPYSKGTPNLHTLYFKMLFDERNLNDTVYQLCGDAEMFYRFPSISSDERIVHPKNQEIKNKNPHTPKKMSTFEYDLIKDKRFTEPQFSLHIPIKLNFKAIGNKKINQDVRLALKNSEHNYVIGIDRGERHLLYITVVDENGHIVEQFTGNEIINSYNGVEHKTDYHQLLDQKEVDRLRSRQNWTSIKSIKELKEGYTSQIVHKICELVVRYDAVIAMEDLNSGFKNSRVKVEKQVYQKFEKMLIDKLNYYVNKNLSPDENGGLLNAYQLTEEFKSFEKMGTQNGFIFYVPAWLTSKIDPTTGFVDLLKPRYTSVEASKDFIGRFKQIEFCSDENMFAFTFDYNDFPKGSTDRRGLWTIYTNGERIRTYRSNEEANGNYISKSIVLTEEFIKLFNSYGIDYMNALKEQILEVNDKSFFAELLKLISLTLQMRNSISNSDVDYLISPVKNSSGEFYDSRKKNDNLPENADANGAYNIARKAHWAINVIRNTPDDVIMKAKLNISNKQWLEYAQNV